MTEIEYGPDVNREELRRQLADSLAKALIVVSSVLIWIGVIVWASLSGWPRPRSFPVAMLGLFAVLAVVGWGVHRLIGVRPALARHLLVWSLTAALLAALALLSEPWLPFLAPILTFISASLVSGGGFVTAGLTAALAVSMTCSGARAYSLGGLFAALAVGVVMACYLVRTFYTALEWAWTMQQRADQLLELARDRQGELSRALRSLDISNALLCRTQRELIVARRQADEARLLKEQFAANVSHELRTPLNLILGFSELMCLSPEVYGDVRWPSSLRQDVYQIHQNSRHLLEMIDDVLDLSRLEMVGFTLDKELTPLGPLVRDAVEMVRGLVRDSPVRLEVEIAPGLPPVELDRIRIRQVLLNLLNNALRFTEQGLVKVTAKRVEGDVVVAVSDTGPGIPPDVLPHLFEEFYQAYHPLDHRKGGAGLGLAISKRFVEAHDGRIWVESPSAAPCDSVVGEPVEPRGAPRTGARGPGSTFFFSLPIPDQYVPFSRLTDGRPLPLLPVEVRPPILVMDPDPTVATLIDRHVEGYEVIQVKERERLAEEVELHHPRAVVCNVRPGERADVSGGGADSVRVPFIECSLPSQAWVAQNLSVMSCLNKPVTSERLLREVERLGDIRDVLVVDDDRGFCQLVERILQASEGTFDVRRAFDGEDGLGAMRARRPDVVLLDLIMPGMDGFQLLKEMRREPALADVPVVLLTATSYAEDVLTQRGGQVVIYRPDGLGPAETLRCLQAVIDVLEPRYDERSALEEALA